MPDREIIFEFDSFRLDVAKRKLLTRDGWHVDLPPRAFDLLLYLVERPGELLDTSTLLKCAWPTPVAEDGYLCLCIFALRRVLGDTAHEHRFIVTAPGRGFVFVAQVRRLSSDPAPAPKVSRFRKRRALWTASVFTVTALIGLVAGLSRSAPPSIAILPFANMSPTHDIGYFTEGIAGKLKESLAGIGSLRVIDRRSAIAFQGRNADARSIGAKLNVDSFIEGSVRISGDWIRISARLVRTQDGISLWSETYDRRIDDVLDIQSAIASDLAAVLAPNNLVKG